MISRTIDPSETCRKNDDRVQPCPRCGFFRKSLPDWAKIGAVFGLNGKLYRIVSHGSSNRNTSFNCHFYDFVTAEEVDEHWEFVKEQSSKSEVLNSLKVLYNLPQFKVEDLEKAMRVL